MTPEERDRVVALFDKLEALERNPRDPQAESLIVDGLARAPHAIYPLVQTVLVQDEALRSAAARIEALEAELGAEPRRDGGFLDTMRDAVFGRGDAPRRGSVPSIGRDPQMNAPRPWSNTQQPMQAPVEPQQAGRGGSFLGTAAASAAGMIGGYMLMNSLGGMFGGHGGQAHAGYDRDAGHGSASPWGGDSANSSLARDAGLGDMGGNGRQGFFDSDDADLGGDDFGDFGGDGGE